MAAAKRRRPVAPAREPQQERSAKTQDKLVRATIREIADRGYAALSTASICRRANLSKGAFFLHFPSKATLVVAAMQRAYDELELGTTRAAADREPGPETIGEGLREIWNQMRTPEYLATTEVYSAARTDAELRDALAPLIDAEIERVHRMLRALWPEKADKHGDFDSLASVVFLALEGAAIESVTHADSSTYDSILGYLEALMLRELQA